MTEKTKRQGDKMQKISSPLSAFHLEADRSGRGLSIILSGIIGISDFSEEYILLRSHGGRITVKGKNLFISVYENNSVEIVGKVEVIEFKYGKN